MKTLTQKVIADDGGDCFGACIGSIFEREDYPNYKNEKNIDWLEQWDKWLEPYNLELVYIPKGRKSPKGYAILVSESTSFHNLNHAVVWYKDTIVWNPNPHQPVGNYIGWFVFATREIKGGINGKRKERI